MPRKQRKSHTLPAHHTGPSIPRARPSVNPLKRRIRDLDRLLSGPKAEGLPADVKIGYERELAAARQELEDAERKVERERMIKKYHMVRFFERKKALRNLKKAKAQLSQAESTETTDKTLLDMLRLEIHNCKVDLQYTMYFPLNMKYSSLYNTKDENSGAGRPGLEDTKQNAIPGTQMAPVVRDHQMWEKVERAMAEGTLKQLREGKSDPVGNGHPEKRASKTTTKSKARKVKQKATSNENAEDNESDDETGGAFFGDD